MVSAHILALALVPWVITFIPKVSAAYSYSSHPAHIRRQVAAPSQLFPVKRSADPSVFKVVVESVPYFRAAPLCLQKGMALADVTTTNWKELVQVEGVGVKAWISSWNQDNYGGACLLLSNTGISIADSCDTELPPLCVGSGSGVDKVAKPKSKGKPKSSTPSKPSGSKSSHDAKPSGSNMTEPHHHNSSSTDHHHHDNSTLSHDHRNGTATSLHHNSTTSHEHHHDESDSKHHHGSEMSGPPKGSVGTASDHHHHHHHHHHDGTASHTTHHHTAVHTHTRTVTSGTAKSTSTHVHHVHVRNGTVNTNSTRSTGPKRLDTRNAMLRMGSR